jgi:hypothetical protein
MTCGCTHEDHVHELKTNNCTVQDCRCYEFITDVEAWKYTKLRWEAEDAEDERAWDDVYRQEQRDREDNEPPSGWTDLGNPGGPTFCY